MLPANEDVLQVRIIFLIFPLVVAGGGVFLKNMFGF